MGVASGLPILPAASCPSAAGAIAAAGLGPICQAASSVVGSAASSVAGFGASSVLDAVGTWVSNGAVWLLDQVGAVLASTTSIDLGASWFTAHYEMMAALAGVVVLPLLLLGILQSIYRQNASMLVRSVLVNVPLAILLTAIAVKLVQLGLAVTDAMSSAVATGAGLDTGHFMASVAADLVATPGSTPAFVLLLGGIAVVLGAVLVWIELLVRSAAVYVAVLFLPLALASLAWPAISHWCRRLVDTLAALVLGKFVIVAVLSLAAGALAGGSGSGSGASASGSASGGGGFTAVLGGAALLLLAAFAPWALLRLLPFMEAGAVGHLEGVGRRAAQQVAVPARGLAQVAMRAAAARSIASTGMGISGPAGSPAGSGGRTDSPGGPYRTAGSSGGADGGGPTAGPSMAESTGVGTMSRPGEDVPMWEPHPGSTAAARRIPVGAGPVDLVADLAERGAGSGERGAGADGEAPPADRAPTGAGFTPLPRQTGALLADSLGRDALGVRLISRPIDPRTDDGGE